MKLKVSKERRDFLRRSDKLVLFNINIHDLLDDLDYLESLQQSANSEKEAKNEH